MKKIILVLSLFFVCFFVSADDFQELNENVAQINELKSVELMLVDGIDGVKPIIFHYYSLYQVIVKRIVITKNYVYAGLDDGRTLIVDDPKLTEKLRLYFWDDGNDIIVNKMIAVAYINNKLVAYRYFSDR